MSSDLKVFVLFCLLFTSAVISQPAMRGQGSSIKGYITDSSTNNPLEFANVVLFGSSDSVQVTGTVTNKEGFFELTRVKPGDYYLKLSFIGFDDQYINDISISRGKSVDLGKINLELTAYSTNAVTVEGERAPVSYEIDKKVINVSEQFSASSGSAVEVLENVPSVTVDIEGNVSLRGSTNFTVLIDGRPSVLDASDALQQIPASAIENIEIITNPSAKYNPEGTSGIINVIMKKNENLGMSGSFELNGGLKDKYGTEGLLDYKAGGYGFNLGADYNKRSFTMNQTGNSATTYQGNSTIINSDGTGNRGGITYGVRGQVNIDFTQDDLFSIGGRYGYRDHSGGSDTRYLETINNVTDAYKSVSDRGRSGDFFSIFTSFKHKFSSGGHEISADINYRYNNGDESTSTSLFDMNNVKTEGQNTTEKGPGKDFEAKADYVLPLSEDSKFEAGWQSEIDHSEDITDFYEYNPLSAQYEIRPQYSNHTNYKRNVHAAYTTFSESIGKLNFQLGFRSELTDRKIELRDSVGNFTINRWDYFPGIHTSFKITEEHQLMASYTRRINRPRGWQLEPFQTWMDAYNIRMGNPALKPEYIDSYEFGYQMLLGKSIISAEGYYRVNNNKVEWVKSVYSNDVTLNTFANVGKDYSLGGEFMFNFDPVQPWNVNMITNLYNYKVEGVLNGNDISKSSFSWNMRLNNMLKITQSTSVQLNGMYNGPQVSAQGENKGSFTLNLAVRQSFLNNSVVATLQVRDLLDSRKHESITQTLNYYSYNKFNPESPMVFLNLKYIFNHFKSERSREDNGNGNIDAGEEF